MSQITTHILDTSIGKPAIGVQVTLELKNSSGYQILGNGATDNDGRVKDLLSVDKKLSPGIYKLIFDTHSYFKNKNVKGFYPSVTIEFEITDETHYHVPLLLNPFGYSTYRGS